MNILSNNKFTSNPYSYLLFYHRIYFCLLHHQFVNVSSINKSTNRHFYIYFYPLPTFSIISLSLFMPMSMSLSSQTFVGINILQIYRLCFCYFYNFCHCLDITNSLKTINKKLLQPKDWVSSIIFNL